MSVIASVLASIILLWISIRTISFAAWNWRNDNKPGSIMVMLVCLTSVVLPVYVAFFKT